MNRIEAGACLPGAPPGRPVAQEDNTIRILHTSDWHLGRTLYGRKRYAEFAAFLDWLLEQLQAHRVDALLIAGDVFDTGTPSNRAQALYYDFLCRVSASCCRHVVIIAGNHDSPSFLNAPRELLRALNVHVVGAGTGDAAEEVVVLHGEERPEAIVCAVPYLRDKDIRTVEAGENIDTKNAKLVEGLKAHYAEVCELAEQTRNRLRQAGQAEIPLIAMGHLFTAGGKTLDDDGVRELYVGSLVHVGQEIFPPFIDYLALGHLHVPQIVAGAPHIRYSGSPIPMGYGEAKQDKIVVLVEFHAATPSIRELTVPRFQDLKRLAGSLEEIQARLRSLKSEGSSAWLEIDYRGGDLEGNLRELLEPELADTAMEIRLIKNRRVMERAMRQVTADESLDDLDSGEVFIRCLDAYAVPTEERAELIAAYQEILQSLHEDDRNAE